MTRQRQILVTVTYNDLGCIIDTKAEPYEEPNLQPTCNNLATDTISRQTAINYVDDIPYIKEHPNLGLIWKEWIEALPSVKQDSKESSLTQKALDSISREDAIDAIKTSRYLVDAMEKIIRLPSAQSKQLKVLASVLDGCPLTQPCDKMWKEGWGKEHCKPGQPEPDAECWLRYAEVMAEDDT